MDSTEFDKQVEKESALARTVKEEMQKVIVGQDTLIDSLLIGCLTDGHLLLEGLPGLAKTLAVNTLAKVLSCRFKRVQFTPDLLPADLIGTTIYHPKEGTFRVSQGPIFTNILLADEINRAPAKVQSALLEVMQERQVTIGNESFSVDAPYLVLATQNPIEHEGTYPLPEAQMDRFMMKVTIDYPSWEQEKEIVRRIASSMSLPQVKPLLDGKEILRLREVVNRVYIDDKVTRYILDIVFATRDPKKYGVDIGSYLLFGASPRASIALHAAAKAHAFLQGRSYVTPNDVKEVGFPVLRHRLRRTYEAEAEEISQDEIIRRIFEVLSIP